MVEGVHIDAFYKKGIAMYLITSLEQRKNLVYVGMRKGMYLYTSLYDGTSVFLERKPSWIT